MATRTMCINHHATTSDIYIVNLYKFYILLQIKKKKSYCVSEQIKCVSLQQPFNFTEMQALFTL